LDGKLIADYKITGQGAGSISFDTNTLAAGVYKYYLTIDGKILDTKSMAVTAK
jgi:azurin